MGVTVWTLNKCTPLLEQEDAAITKLFAKNGMPVSFGERDQIMVAPPVPTRKPPATESRRQLMPEIEYFVPIPLKCIGNKHRARDLESDGQAVLDALIAKYPYFHHADQFTHWWTPEAPKQKSEEVEHLVGRPHMTTASGVGYYELLERHEHNILIGYSQGGLVARYLAFLDRYVFKRNIITAVITVSSPNYGSALANPDNKNHIAAGILQFLAALASFHPGAFQRFTAELDKLTFDPIYEAIDAARNDATTAEHGATNVLETAVKWLSGLKGDRNNAFDEVDIKNFRDPLSVLSLVNANPPAGVYTGSIISANPDLDDILRSALLGDHTHNIVQRAFAFAKKKALDWARRNVNLFKIPLGQNELVAGVVYQTKIMAEHLTGDPSKQELALQRDYETGRTILKPLPTSPKMIPSRAHDFIIPSANQILPDDPRSLGQFLNLQASHNSGKSTGFPAGRVNRDTLLTLLATLASRLEREPTSPKKAVE